MGRWKNVIIKPGGLDLLRRGLDQEISISIGLDCRDPQAY